MSPQLYHLTPCSLRYLTAYVRCEERRGTQRAQLPVKVAAWVATWALAVLMPPRTFDAAEERSLRGTPLTVASVGCGGGGGCAVGAVGGDACPAKGRCPIMG